MISILKETNAKRFRKYYSPFCKSEIMTTCVFSLILRYSAVGYPDYVNYTLLVEDIESIFTLNSTLFRGLLLKFWFCGANQYGLDLR